MVYKDTCNRKSNQQNLGTIKSSNLCTEIVEYTSKDEVAVCNLASISLSRFVDLESRSFNYERLHEVTQRVTKNLNKVIDRNHYPVEEARNSNMKHRPIGIGVQGFADALMMMGIPFEDPAAIKASEMPVKITWDNLKFSARVEDKDKKKCCSSAMKELNILKGCSGSAMPGQATYIMGSSGAGKTSLTADCT